MKKFLFVILALLAVTAVQAQVTEVIPYQVVTIADSVYKWIGPFKVGDCAFYDSAQTNDDIIYRMNIQFNGKELSSAGAARQPKVRVNAIFQSVPNQIMTELATYRTENAPSGLYMGQFLTDSASTVTVDDSDAVDQKITVALSKDGLAGKWMWLRLDNTGAPGNGTTYLGFTASCLKSESYP